MSLPLSRFFAPYLRRNQKVQWFIYLMLEQLANVLIFVRMKDEVEDGKIVYAPKAKSSSKKRKARGSPKSRKKRRASSESESNSDNSTDEDYNDAETSDESESENVTKEPLSEEQISSKISEIKAKKKKARLDRADIERQIKKLDAEIKPLEVRSSLPNIERQC